MLNRFIAACVAGLCLVLGVALVGAVFLGDLIGGPGAEVRYVDPRVPTELEPGSYAVDWLGPAKGNLPLAFDLDVAVRSSWSEAVFTHSSLRGVYATGSYEDDLGRSPMGTLRVRSRTVASLSFRPDGRYEGAPRLLLSRTEATTSGRTWIVLTVGVVLLLSGSAGIVWARGVPDPRDVHPASGS